MHAGLRSLLLCCLAATGAVSATQQQPPTFRAGTRVVPIYATVQGGDGRLLVNLRKEDFEVLDNGKPQIIASFSSQTEPILGVALWDVSGSLEPTAVLSRSAATALVKALWPGDRIRFGSFGQEVAFSPLLTGDKPTLERIVNEELWFGGSSRLWYALERSLNLVRVERGRRVVIVLTDGRSMADSRSQNDALMAVHRADTMVYALGLDETGLAGGIRAIAEESGGGHSILKGGPEYDSQLEAVMVELHHQYLLGFVTEAADRKLHSLVVRTTIPGAKVRARRGYVAELPEQQSR